MGNHLPIDSLHAGHKMWGTKCWLFTLPCGFSVASDTVTSWTITHQTPRSMGFSQQEYWSGLPFPPPGDLSDRGVELVSPSLQADSLLLSHRGSP